MDFLKDQLKTNLEQMLMEQWQNGYNDGIRACIGGLEMMLDTGKISEESAATIRSIIAGFKLGIE